MESWVFSLNANRTVVVHSQKWCLSLYRIREWFGKVTDKFVCRKIFQKIFVCLYFPFGVKFALVRRWRAPVISFGTFFYDPLFAAHNRLISSGVAAYVSPLYPLCRAYVLLLKKGSGKA